MKHSLISLCVALIALIHCRVYAQIPPHQWSADIEIKGEDGNPVGGADVTITYDLHPMSRESGKGITWDQIKGLTDTNGIFMGSHTDNSFDLGLIVEKAGYYPTRSGYQFNVNEKSQNLSFKLLLKRIGKPVAMYAKKEEAKIPQEKEPVGFDLMAGDWVSPFGAGKTSDMLFTVHRDIVNPQKFDAELELAFTNAGDGIAIVPPSSDNLGFSPLVMPRAAEETGYQSKVAWVYHNFTETSIPASGYYFRVRTVLDSNGSIKSALYGKIQGDVRFLVGSKAPQAGLSFTYYLNPTPNDRNLEFDPTRNLFNGLPSDEQVKSP